MNLKEAIAKNKLKQFIKAQGAKTADQRQFDATVSSMVRGKSKVTPAKSKRKPSAD